MAILVSLYLDEDLAKKLSEKNINVFSHKDIASFALEAIKEKIDRYDKEV